VVKWGMSLGELFELKARQNPNKPGRELYVVYDKRFPVVPGFEVNYEYFVEFQNEGSVAGNHYHKLKREIFVPISGDFEVMLINPETKENEIIELKESEHKVLFVPSMIAHRVTSKNEKSKLLVLATSPNEDEFGYVG